jgi:hypothetical protein
LKREREEEEHFKERKMKNLMPRCQMHMPESVDCRAPRERKGKEKKRDRAQRQREGGGGKRKVKVNSKPKPKIGHEIGLSDSRVSRAYS